MAHATAPVSRTRTLLEFVKIEHTLFALPFVLAGMLLGFAHENMAWFTWESARVFVLVLVAATGARTLGMTLNRIVDRAIDAANPRTATRALAAGTMGMGAATLLAVVSGAALVGAAALLPPLVLMLSPVLALLFFLYPYAKRVTWMCHFVLGLAFLCAPVGGYLAVTGAFEGWFAPLWLALAAMAWVSGFDVIYALLDVDFDRSHGVQSVPARWGVEGARRLAVVLHAATVGFLGVFSWQAGLGLPGAVAVVVVGALLVHEHRSVEPTDVDAINRAFFQVNAVVGWIVLAGVAAGLSI